MVANEAIPETQTAQVTLEVRNPRPLVRRVAKWVGAIGLVGLSVVGADDLLGHFDLPHFGISLPDFHAPGTTSPTGEVHRVAGSAKAQSFTIPIECPDNITQEAAVETHNRYLFLGGGRFSKPLPERSLACPNGKTYKLTGKVKKIGDVNHVTASEADFVPTETGIDANDPQNCMPLDESATEKQIKKAEEEAASAKRKGQTLNCDWGFHTTGLRYDSDNSAAGDVWLGFMLGQDEAEIDTFPTPLYKQVVKDLYKLSVRDLRAIYGLNAVIDLTPAPVPSVTDQFKDNWVANKANITWPLDSYSVASAPNGDVVLKIHTYEGGLKGSVDLGVKLASNKKQNEEDIVALNAFMHQKTYTVSDPAPGLRQPFEEKS